MVRDNLGNLVVERRIQLKQIVEKQNMVCVDWIHLAQDGFECSFFFDTAMNVAVHLRQIISSLGSI